MSTASYDRLAELGAATIPGLIPGSKVQVVHCQDGGVVLWTTTEAGDVGGAGIVLDPAAADQLRQAIAGAPGSGEVRCGR